MLMTINVSHCLLVNWAIILAFLSHKLPSKDNTNGFHDPLSRRFARYKSSSSRCIRNHQHQNRSVVDWPLIVWLTLITDLSLQTTSVRERVTAAHVRSRFVSKRLWLDYPRNQLLFNKGIFGKQRKRQRGRTKQGQRSNDTHSTSLPRF